MTDLFHLLSIAAQPHDHGATLPPPEPRECSRIEGIAREIFGVARQLDGVRARQRAEQEEMAGHD